MWIWITIAVIGIIIMILYYSLVYYNKNKVNKITNEIKENEIFRNIEIENNKKRFAEMSHVSDIDYDIESDWEKLYENEFYAQAATTTTSGSDKAIDIIDSVTAIDAINFVGEYSISSNGKWFVGLEDYYDYGDKVIQGCRDSGNGRVVIFDLDKQKALFTTKNLERPKSGSVANNGSICVADIFFSLNLSSALYVFSRDGRLLFKKNFSANIYNAKISDSGLFVICQTANSATPDGGKLTLFNIDAGQEVFSINDIYGWALNYKIDESNKIISVQMSNDSNFYRYDFCGNKLDTQKMIEDKLTSNDYGCVVYAAEDALKDELLAKEKIKHILKHLIRIKPTVASQCKPLLPKLYRLTGSCFERIENRKKAICFYENALKLDPKIGIKRKLATLKKLEKQ